MGEGRSLADLPSALDEGLIRRLVARAPAVFLDYDGTLAAIAPSPDRAVMPEPTRAAVERLSAACPVGVISGRDLADARRMVGIEGMVYAGSHGLDIEGPGGVRAQRGTESLPELDRAEKELASELEGVPGSWVERKRFAVAVHYRQVEGEESVRRVEEAARAAAGRSPGLRLAGGKRIFELRPDIEWDKGRALEWVLEVLGLEGPEVVPVYVGDDITDEDAFRVLRDRGVGVVVRGADGGRATLAERALDGPEEVRAFLERLAEALERNR